MYMPYGDEPSYPPSSDIIGSAGPESEWVQVANPGIFGVAQAVKLIDSAHPDGEMSDVNSVEGDNVVLTYPPTGHFIGGYEDPTGRGAALVKNDAGFYSVDVMARLKEAYGDIHDPTGKTHIGCFVDFRKCISGHNRVPYKPLLNSTGMRIDFSRVWFANRGQRNAIHLLLVDNIDGQNQFHGFSRKDEAFSYISWRWASGYPRDADMQATVAHELCHQFWEDLLLFESTPTDGNHKDVASWWPTGSSPSNNRCVMDTTQTHAYSYSMPCHFCRDHLMRIRREWDSL